jgi:hypothetical protein
MFPVGPEAVMPAGEPIDNVAVEASEKPPAPPTIWVPQCNAPPALTVMLTVAEKSEASVTIAPALMVTIRAVVIGFPLMV